MRLINTVLVAESGPKSRLSWWRAFRGQPWGHPVGAPGTGLHASVVTPLSSRATLHPLSPTAPRRDDLGARSPRLPCLLPSVLAPTVGGSWEIWGWVEREGGAFGTHVSLLGAALLAGPVILSPQPLSLWPSPPTSSPPALLEGVDTASHCCSSLSVPASQFASLYRVPAF